jgi:hypothetical protein
MLRPKLEVAMPRLLAFSLVALVAGCSSDGLPINGATPQPLVDGGSSSRLGDGATPVSPGTISDGGFRPDMRPPHDGGPRCMTACDCPSGQGCLFGRCSAMFGTIYCCGSAVCPGTSMCQAPSGQLSRCGGGVDLGPPVDAGPVPFDAGSASFDGGGYCQFVPCMSDQICQIARCGSCDIAAGHCVM